MKLVLVLLIILAMLISFAAIGVVVLFATGTVKNFDELQALLAGRAPTGEIASAESGDLIGQDAFLLFEQQKAELLQEIKDLKLARQRLLSLSDALPQGVDALKTLTGGPDLEARLQKVVGVISEMRPANAAVIFDHLDDETVLLFLVRLEEEHAARILTALADDQRKADLMTALAKGLGQ